MTDKAYSQRINNFVQGLDKLDNISGSAAYFLRVADKIGLPQALPGPVKGLVILADLVGVNGAYAAAFSAAVKNEDYALATQIVVNRYGCKALAIGASAMASSAVLATMAPGAGAAYIVPPAGMAASAATALATVTAGVLAYNATEHSCSNMMDSMMQNPAFRNQFNANMKVAIQRESGMLDWLGDKYSDTKNNLGMALDPRTWMRSSNPDSKIDFGTRDR